MMMINEPCIRRRSNLEFQPSKELRSRIWRNLEFQPTEHMMNTIQEAAYRGHQIFSVKRHYERRRENGYFWQCSVVTSFIPITSRERKYLKAKDDRIKYLEDKVRYLEFHLRDTFDKLGDATDQLEYMPLGKQYWAAKEGFEST